MQETHLLLTIKYAIFCLSGRSLSVLASSQVIVNPDNEECYALRGWYDAEGHQMEFNEYQSSGGASGGGGYFHAFGQFNTVTIHANSSGRAKYIHTFQPFIHVDFFL